MTPDSAPRTEQEEQREVLRVLARAAYPMRRRAIEEAVFGKTGHTAWPTIKALASLERQGLVERAYRPDTGQFDRCWRITAGGLKHAEGVEVFHPSGGVS